MRPKAQQAQGSANVYSYHGEESDKVVSRSIRYSSRCSRPLPIRSLAFKTHIYRTQDWLVRQDQPDSCSEEELIEVMVPLNSHKPKSCNKWSQDLETHDSKSTGGHPACVLGQLLVGHPLVSCKGTEGAGAALWSILKDEHQYLWGQR